VKATLESIPVDRPEPTQESPQGICVCALITWKKVLRVGG